MYAYLKKTYGKDQIVVKNIEHKIIGSLFRQNVLSIHWVKNSLLIQTKDKIIIYDPKKGKISIFKNISLIIEKIVYSYKTWKFIIEVINNDESIHIFLVNLEDNNISKLICLRNKDKISLYCNMDKPLKKIVKNYIYKRTEQNKYQRIDSCFDKNYSYIVENGTIYKLNGFIDRYVYMQDDIVLSIGNFITPTQIMLFSDFLEFRKDIKKDGFSHKWINGIPVYDNELIAEETIVFLHGGPNSSFLPLFDYLIYYLSNIKKRRIILLNYPGSTGYSKAYQTSLYGNGGRIDLDSIMSVILSLKINTEACIVIGESYGGYLATMLAFTSELTFNKCVSINGFTDLFFQYIFSPARQVILKYFDISDRAHVKNVNPIELAKHKKITQELIFLHSTNDKICPIGQIQELLKTYKETFSDVHCNQLSLEKIDDISHEQFDINERIKLTSKLITVLEK